MSSIHHHPLTIHSSFSSQSTPPQITRQPSLPPLTTFSRSNSASNVSNVLPPATIGFSPGPGDGKGKLGDEGKIGRGRNNSVISNSSFTSLTRSEIPSIFATPLSPYEPNTLTHDNYSPSSSSSRISLPLVPKATRDRNLSISKLGPDLGSLGVNVPTARDETVIDMTGGKVRVGGGRVGIRVLGVDGEEVSHEHGEEGYGEDRIGEGDDEDDDLIVHSSSDQVQGVHAHPSRSRNGSLASNLSTSSPPPEPNTVSSSAPWYSLTSKPRPLLIALLKAALLFIFSLLILIFLLKSLLPPIDPADLPAVKIPKSFEDLKALNAVLQVYKKHQWRVAGCFVVTYLFLQAFSLPGSMYMSILGGAMWGVEIALPVVCCCVATGALLCYLISSFLGPVLLANSKKWRNRLERWQKRIHKQGGNVISYLIVIRIAPLPPHWVVNVVCPHLGIGVGTFWISTFLGIMGVSFIHTQIGTTLDQMTSPGDFHLISWRNFFGLAGIVFAVMIPVAIRYAWRSELTEAATEDVDPTTVEGVTNEGDLQEGLLPLPSTSKSPKSKSKLLYIQEEDEEEVGDDRSFIGNASIKSFRSVESFASSFSQGGISYHSDMADSGDEDEEQPFIHKNKSGKSSKKSAKGKSSGVKKHEKKKSLKEVIINLGGGGGEKKVVTKKKKASIGGTGGGGSECERMVMEIRGDGNGSRGKERMASEDRIEGGGEVVV